MAGDEDDRGSNDDKSSKVERVNRRLSPIAELLNSTKVIIASAVVVVIAVVGVGARVLGTDDSDQSSTTTRLTVPPSTAPLALTSTASDGNLTVSVGQFSEDTTDQRAGELLLLPSGSPEATAVPRERSSPADWLVPRGAIPAFSQSLNVILTSTKPVTVLSIAPEIVKRGPLEPGDLFKHPFGCGVAPVRSAEFDLDATPPTVVYATDDSQAPQPSLVLTLNPGTQEVVAVKATTRTADVTWKLAIKYQLDGQRFTLPIEHDGTPFRVTGAAPGTPVYTYQYATGAERDPGSDAQPDGYC